MHLAPEGLRYRGKILEAQGPACIDPAAIDNDGNGPAVAGPIHVTIHGDKAGARPEGKDQLHQVVFPNAFADRHAIRLVARLPVLGLIRSLE